MEPSSPSDGTSASSPCPTDGAAQSGAEESEEEDSDLGEKREKSRAVGKRKREMKEGHGSKETSTDENANGVQKMVLSLDTAATLPELYKETQQESSSLGR